MKKLSALCLSALFVSACAMTPSPAPVSDFDLSSIIPATTSNPAQMDDKRMSWGDLTSRPLPEPSHAIKWGDGETDVVDLWLPDRAGPHPVVVMVHGGCWQKSIADRTLMNYAAEDLRAKGLAVWNIEYRGVDEDSGGYPGTYQDVAKAVDSLRDYSKAYNLDLSQVLGIGHSAGGHLVTWLSTRANLPETSPLHMQNPLPLYAVINSGGLADLEESEPVTFAGCLQDIRDTLVGIPNDTRPDVYSDTSPVNLFPTHTYQISVNGDKDSIAPPRLGQSYTAKARASGMQAEFVLIEPSGHVELVSPDTLAWDVQSQILLNLAGSD